MLRPNYLIKMIGIVALSILLCFERTVSESNKTSWTESIGKEVDCEDREHRRVPSGMRYAPDADPCKTCYCANGLPQMCTLVQCSPPLCNEWRPVQNECCQFECLDGSVSIKNDRNNSFSRYGLGNVDSASFDIRLALSGTTTLLIIALLVFMVHRLRQRRLLIIMRRMAEDQHCIDSEDNPYGTEIITGFEFLAYKDPPPPYSSPPGTLNRHYDPPPYETATRVPTSENAEACSLSDVVSPSTSENVFAIPRESSSEAHHSQIHM